MFNSPHVGHLFLYHVGDRGDDMQKIQCEKCGHFERVEQQEEYTCSICGFDSCMTIAQEISNHTVDYNVDDIEDGLWEGSILIAYTWEDCDFIEAAKNPHMSLEIMDMGITVYWVTP